MRNASNATASLLSLITYVPVGNSWAITYVPRLDLDHFESQLDSPGLMQRFLKIGLLPEISGSGWRILGIVWKIVFHVYPLNRIRCIPVFSGIHFAGVIQAAYGQPEGIGVVFVIIT